MAVDLKSITPVEAEATVNLRVEVLGMELHVSRVSTLYRQAVVNWLDQIRNQSHEERATIRKFCGTMSDERERLEELYAEKIRDLDIELSEYLDKKTHRRLANQQMARLTSPSS